MNIIHLNGHIKYIKGVLKTCDHFKYTCPLSTYSMKHHFNTSPFNQLKNGFECHLGCSGHGTSHLHLRVHDLCLRGHRGDLGADSVCAVLLLPELDQLLGQDLAGLSVTALCHFLDLCLLRDKHLAVTQSRLTVYWAATFNWYDTEHSSTQMTLEVTLNSVHAYKHCILINTGINPGPRRPFGCKHRYNTVIWIKCYSLAN